jgi:uncharacterized protein YoaH (UPF0181 family)
MPTVKRHPHRAKTLTAEDIETIRAGLSSGQYVSQVATTLRIAVRTVRQVCADHGITIPKAQESRRRSYSNAHARPRVDTTPKALPDRYYRSNFEPS